MKQPHWLILFDAVGTLIDPEPDVITAYHQIGRQFGSQLSPEQIAERFKIGRIRFFGHKDSGYSINGVGLKSSDSIERGLWLKLVEFVLADVHPVAPAFELLWDHFASPENWKVFSDVEACWEALRKLNATIGIASNFDSRLRPIAQALKPLPEADFLFCSAEIGFRKPDPEFYSNVQRRAAAGRQTKIWMVGDSREHDVEGPQNAGWNSTWLNRRIPRSSNPPTHPKLIRSLAELPDLILRSESA